MIEPYSPLCQDIVLDVVPTWFHASFVANFALKMSFFPLHSTLSFCSFLFCHWVYNASSIVVKQVLLYLLLRLVAQASATNIWRLIPKSITPLSPAISTSLPNGYQKSNSKEVRSPFSTSILQKYLATSLYLIIFSKSMILSLRFP